jgi:hypothetical protein
MGFPSVRELSARLGQVAENFEGVVKVQLQVFQAQGKGIMPWALRIRTEQGEEDADASELLNITQAISDGRDYWSAIHTVQGTKGGKVKPFPTMLRHYIASSMIEEAKDHYASR